MYILYEQYELIDILNFFIKGSMLLRWMIFTLKIIQLFVYGYPSNSIVEAHFIYDQLLYYIICKVLNK